ncbi:hypothetical protein ACHAXT_010461 [Thalassiosira profunda]
MRPLHRLSRSMPGRRGSAATSLWARQPQSLDRRAPQLQCLPRHFGAAATDGAANNTGGLSVYDSLSSRRRILPPHTVPPASTSQPPSSHPRGTAWYACGPTVYDAAHLGHGRTYVLLDVLRRVATSEHDASGANNDGNDTCVPQPLFVMNVTDVDDKIIARSIERGVDPLHLARKYEREFWEDMDSLNVLRPDVICRVSEHVAATIVPYIQQILDGGMAYVIPEQQPNGDSSGTAAGGGEGSVYFDVRAFESVTGGRTKYGKLAPDAASTDFYLRESEERGGHNNVDEEGAPINGKRDPRDFCLWKYRSQTGADAEPASVSYPSPWGYGRPGWHVECSAMIQRLSEDFAATHEFGVHAGGVDLKFPHHSNEIAQAEAYTASFPSGRDTAKVEFREWIPHWIHTGHLYVKGRKMSKSLKNFVTVREMLGSTATKSAWASPADDFRLWCLGLSGSYRGPATYSQDRMDEARSIREGWIRFLMEGQECLERWQSMDDGADENVSTRLWGDEELRLFHDVTQCAMRCRQALRDDLDGASYVRELNRIAALGLAYVDRAKADMKGKSRPEEPLRFVLDAFRGQLALVGFTPRTVNAGLSARDASSSEQSASAVNAALVDEAVAFRTAVRSASLDAIRKKTEGLDSLKEILGLCDELRDVTFPKLGVEILDGKVGSGIEDGEASRGWRYCAPRGSDQEDDGGSSDNEEEEVMVEVQKANESFLGQLQVKRVNPHQWGVFASRSFPAGSVVISSRPLAGTSPNPSPDSCAHSIQIGWNAHVIMELPARFLNHSCDPNVGVGGVNEWGSYDFVALRPIGAGEEISFDYETTEYEVGAFSECLCGAANCRGTVRGYKHSADVIRATYGEEHIAEYLTRGR